MLRQLPWFIFVLLLVLLPTQLGWHFWPKWALINGIRVDYFSPTLYLTDVLVFLLFCLEIRSSKFNIQNSKLEVKSLLIYCFIGLLIYLNISHSLSPFVSLYKWVKAVEFALLAYWVAKHFCHSNKRPLFIVMLMVPVFYESVLAVWQFVNQSSVGGMWYWLGERTFNAATLGVANTYVNGGLVMRPYGTFSHPNVLGGFLAVLVPVILAQFLHNSRRIYAQSRGPGGLGKLGILGILGLGYAGLFLSMSRAAILVGVVVSLWVLRRTRFWLGILVGLGILGIWLFPRFLALDAETESIVFRQQLNNLAVQQFIKSPLLGTGLGTAPLYVRVGNGQVRIGNYALAFQPVHNIYLLAIAETGLLGLGSLGLLGGTGGTKAVGSPTLNIGVGFGGSLFFNSSTRAVASSLGFGYDDLIVKIEGGEEG